MTYNQNDLQQLDKLPRVQLATSLPGAKPICLVGTQSAAGQPNLAPFSSITHLGSSPMLIGMVTRPASVERHTLSNIMETEQWTLNHVHPGILEAAHQCSARYPREISEFGATGLTPDYVDGITPPLLAEAVVRYALELREIIDIKSNDTKLIVGEVCYLDYPDEAQQADGGINLVQTQSLASTALDTYFTLRKHAQLPYAKP